MQMRFRSQSLIVLIILLAVCFPSLALAEEAPALNSGDTAWMLTATAFGAFYDHSRFVSVLRRHGAKQERPVGIDAMLCDHFPHDRFVGHLRLQHGLWRCRRILGWIVQDFLERCDGRLAQRQHSRIRFYDVPNDVRHHHSRSDRWGVCGTYEILRDTDFHGSLVYRRLRPCLPLGLGEKADGSDQRAFWILQAVRSSTSMPGSPVWSLPSFWANARDILKNTCLLITWDTP